MEAPDPTEGSHASNQQQRSRFRAARRSIVGEQRRQAVAAIGAHLDPLAMLRRARTLAVTFADDGEPDLLSWAATIPARLVLPRIDDADRMDFVEFQPGESLEPGRYQIPVPTSVRPVADESIDVVIAPLVAFDAHGNRLGRGKGYYDAFLARADALVIGVAFEQQRSIGFETHSGDVALDAVVTQLGIRWAR